jgi:hypothetical protein
MVIGAACSGSSGSPRIRRPPTLARDLDSWIEFYRDFYQFPADLLAASRDVLASLRVRRSDELFTFGFSQGGHAALALQRVLEKRRVDVTATATAGGVFDVERFFPSAIADEATVTLPLYVSYILLAYDDIYDVYGRPGDVFRRPYAATVPGLFDMRHFFDDVLAGLPPTSRELLMASYLRAVSGNPDHPLRVRLRQNAVDRWRPDAPVRVYHSPDDEEVFFEDMLVSVDRLRNRGADVTVRTMPGLDHVNSWVQAMPRAARYFRAWPDDQPPGGDGRRNRWRSRSTSGRRGQPSRWSLTRPIASMKA